MSNIKDKSPRDKDGKPHGEWVEYHSNGQLCCYWNFVHGVRHGFIEGYYSNAILAYRGHYNMSRKWDIGIGMDKNVIIYG